MVDPRAKPTYIYVTKVGILTLQLLRLHLFVIDIENIFKNKLNDIQLSSSSSLLPPHTPLSQYLLVLD